MNYELIEYKEEFGPINWPEGFQNELIGRTIEKQVRCYAWSEDYIVGDDGISYKELEQYCRIKSYQLSHIKPMDFKRFKVKDGLVVGVVIGENDYILPYKGYAYDYTCDNNGAGYKERYWYRFLICLPYNHTLWE